VFIPNGRLKSNASAQVSRASGEILKLNLSQHVRCSSSFGLLWGTAW